MSKPKTSSRRKPGRASKGASSGVFRPLWLRVPLLALLMLLSPGNGALADEVGNSPTWDAANSNTVTTYQAGNQSTVTTSSGNTLGNLTRLYIYSNAAPWVSRNLVFAHDTTFIYYGGMGGGYSGSPYYAQLTVNPGVTFSLLQGMSMLADSRININGTYVGGISLMGADARVNVGGTLLGNVNILGYDPNTTILTSTNDAAKVSGDVNVAIGQVLVNSNNLEITGNTSLYGHPGQSTVNVSGKTLQLDGNLTVGHGSNSNGSDSTGTVNVQNGGTLNMHTGSTVSLLGESASSPAVLNIEGGSTGATANLGTLNVGSGGYAGSLLIDGGTAPLGSTKAIVQTLGVAAGSKAEVRNQGVLELAPSGASLDSVLGTLNVHGSGEVLTHNASITDSRVSGQGGTGLSLWNNGQWVDTGTITLNPASGGAVLASQGIISAQALKAGSSGNAALTLGNTSGNQTVNLSGDGTTFLTATSLTVDANNTLNLAGAGGSFAGPVTVAGGTLNTGAGTWNLSNAASGLSVSAGSANVLNGSTLKTGQLNLSGSGTTNVATGGTLINNGAMTLAGTSQLAINGGTASSLGTVTTSNTAGVVINGGSFTAPTLNAGSAGGMTLNTGSLNLTNTNASAAGAVAINGGTAALGALHTTATNGVAVTGGVATATDITTSASQGLNISGGTMTANTLTSTAAGGATVSGGTLTINDTINVGSTPGAVLVTGGHLVLDPAGSVVSTNSPTQGTITVNGMQAVLQGAWDTFMNKVGAVVDHQANFLDMQQGTLLLTGKDSFTLEDLAAAYKNNLGADLGSKVLVSIQGNLVNGGDTSTIDQININTPDFNKINGGLFGADLVQTSTPTPINIVGTGGANGAQNIGFKNVDLGHETMTIGQGSSLTVVGSITNGDAGKPITLDNGTLALGSAGTASGGTVSTGITTTGTDNNHLNLGNGSYVVNGDITHDPSGKLAMDIERGTLTADNVNTTTLDVSNGGTLHATGDITTGSLTDGTNVGNVSSGTITADGNMTVTSGGINAVNGSHVTVADTLTVGNNGDVTAASGSTISTGTLAATGNIAATDTGSSISVGNAYTAQGTVTASNGGTVAFDDSLTTGKAVKADGGTVSVGMGSGANLTLTGSAPLTADNGGLVRVGGDVVSDGNVLADHNGAVNVTGDMTAKQITAQNGGDILAGSLTADGPVLVDGAGSTLQVVSALTAGTNPVTASNNGAITVGSVASAGNILATDNGAFTSLGDVHNTGTTVAQSGGDIAVGGNLTSTGSVGADGIGSTLIVNGILNTNNTDFTVTNGARAVLGSVTNTANIRAQDAGSAITTTGDVTNSGLTSAVDGGSIAVGGALHSALGVTADNGKVNATGDLTTPVDVVSQNNGYIHSANLSAVNVTAQTGGSIMAEGTINATGDLQVTGTGSTLLATKGATIAGDLTAAGGGKVALGGNVSAASVTAGDSTGSGNIGMGANLTSTGPVTVAGAGSTLGVNGALTATNQTLSVTDGAKATFGSIAAIKDIEVTGSGGTPVTPSTLVVHGNAAQTGSLLVDAGHMSVGGNLTGGTSVTLDHGGLLGVLGNLGASGDITLANASGLGTGGSLTAGALTATGASAISAGSVNLAGPVSLTGGSALITPGNFALTGPAGQTVTVGAVTDAAGSTLNAGSHTGGTAATYFVASGAAASPSTLQFGSVSTPLNDTLIGGQNSVTAIGPRPLTWVADQTTASGVKPSTTLALTTPVTLGPSAQLLMGDKYSADGKWNNATTADAYGLALRGNSLLVTDAGANPTPLLTPLLTLGGSKNTVLIEPTASLRFNIDGIRAEQTYPLVGGLASTNAVSQNGSTWLAQGAALNLASMTSSNSLIGVNNVSLSGNQLVVTTKSLDAKSVLPGVSDSAADYLNAIAVNHGFDTNHANSGSRFIARALDNRYGGADLSRSAKIIEGGAQMAVAGGVHGTTFGTIQNSASAVTGRTAFASPLMHGNTLTALHLDEKGVQLADNSGLAAGDDDMANVGSQNGIGLWAMPMYQHSNVHGMQVENMKSGYSNDLGGLMVGADYTFNDIYRLGMSINAGGGNATSNGDFNSTKNSIAFWGVHLYGGVALGNFGLAADAGYSRSTNDVRQSLDAGMQMQDLKADVDSYAWSAGLRGEYKIRTDALDIIPHVGTRYHALTVDGHNVVGDDTLFRVDKSTQHIWTFPVGVTLTKNIETASGWVVKPQLDLGVTPAAGNVKATTRATIPGIDGALSLKSQVTDYLSYDAGLGLELQKGGFALGINYQLQASEHRTGHGLFGTVRYAF